MIVCLKCGSQKVAPVLYGYPTYETFDRSSVETYAFVIAKASGKSLADLRAEYMEKN